MVRFSSAFSEPNILNMHVILVPQTKYYFICGIKIMTGAEINPDLTGDPREMYSRILTDFCSGLQYHFNVVTQESS